MKKYHMELHEISHTYMLPNKILLYETTLYFDTTFKLTYALSRRSPTERRCIAARLGVVAPTECPNFPSGLSCAAEPACISSLSSAVE